MLKTIATFCRHTAIISALLIAMLMFDRKQKITANELFMEAGPMVAEVEGTVRNEDGLLLSNVNVLIKGTQRSTMTSAAGRFSISVNAGEEATLVFSLTGYQSQEIHLGTKTTLDVMLKAESNSFR